MERLCYPPWFEGLGQEVGLDFGATLPNKVGERAETHAQHQVPPRVRVMVTLIRANLAAP